MAPATSLAYSTALDSYLDFHGFADAKIAHAASYPTDANWKLVVENFVECYHCSPAHPEFVSMHPPQALVAFGAGPSSGPSAALDQYLFEQSLPGSIVHRSIVRMLENRFERIAHRQTERDALWGNR